MERLPLTVAVVVGLSLAGPTLALGADPQFVECSGPAGIAVEHHPASGLLLSLLALPPYMIAGGCVGDFNNDGWQDIFVLTSGGAPDYLFLNNHDGTFTDRAEDWGIGERHMGFGACAGDYNNDGWLDIYMTSFGPGPNPHPGKHRLYRNDAGRGFTEVAAEAGVNQTVASTPGGFSPAFGDYDLDGDLDLFVTSWQLNSQGNRLFRNDGDGTFTDVTIQVGIVAHAVRGFSPRFVDMNGDRYPELLIAADFGTSQYYVNNGDGSFMHFTAQSGTGLDGNGMGHTVADFDGDGLLDWYVTSIDSENSGMPWVPGTGNMLYLNQGNHTFVEVSEQAGVSDGGWGWGTVAVDLNHDGLTDIVETNGWGESNGDGETEWRDEQCYAFLNQGGALFQDISAESGIADHTLFGRGLMNLDFDNDGDQDILVLSFWDELRLYRNDLIGSEQNWLRILLETGGVPGVAPNGFGTKVIAFAGGSSQTKHLDGGSNYLSQSELSVHFGLGDANTVDLLRIEWADGTETELPTVAVNRTITVPHPALGFVRGDCNGDGDFTGLGDCTFLLGYAFSAAPEAPRCLEACDADGDAILNGLVDALYLLNYQYLDGPAPLDPFPGCGPDVQLQTGVGCRRPHVCP